MYYKFVLFLLAIFSCATSYAREFQSLPSEISEDSLYQMVTPHYESLGERLNFGENKLFSKAKEPTIIQAYKTEIVTVKETLFHYGYYSDGKIVTVLKDPSGEYAAGTQGLYIGNDLKSVASSMHVEKIKDVEYVRHDHKAFSVYTNGQGQFVKTHQ